MSEKLTVDQTLTAMESLCSDIESKIGIGRPRDWGRFVFRAAIVICFAYVVLDSVGWAHPIEHALGMRPLAAARCIDLPAKFHPVELTRN